MLALRLLGPLVLNKSGTALTLPTTKAAAVVAWLALDGPAPRSRIAAALWPGQDAAGARRNLRRELARLREAGAGELLVSDGERLLLHADVHLDVQLFGADIAALRHDAALALWRGPVADGLSLPDAPVFEDVLAGARTRLLRQRMAALEASAAACEARGEGAAALRAIETLLAEDPLQEAHQRTAMRLHAAAGRRAAALAGYDRFAALLAGELGLTPMADTVALVRTLRQVDAPPVTPAPMAPRAPAPATAAQAVAWQGPALLPFVGREDELAQLGTAWRDGLALVIEGPAGIGKTRLASEFAGARGAFALAACRPGDAAQPYAAFTRALRRLAGQALSQTLQGDDWPRWVRDELAHVLPELGQAPNRIDSEAARQRFFEACAEAWSLLAAGSFDAVIVDDWHLADAPSRALFDHIVRQRSARRGGGVEGEGEGPRAILLLRPGLLPADRAPIDALVHDGVARHLVLSPLLHAAMEQLAAQLGGTASPPPRLVARLASASGGNPFAIGETLRHWAALSLWTVGAEGRWAPGDDGPLGATADADDAVSDAVRQAVLARVAGLPDAARRVLEAAALATEPFAPALLAGACALTEVQALDAVDAAMAAHLLRERDGGFAFTHDLVQAALEGALGAERARLVHRRLALGAEALRGGAAVPPAEIARHWELGGQPERAVGLRLAASEAAWALFSEDAAEHHWTMALADGATPAQQVRIAARRGAMARNRDDLPGMQAAADELDRLREACAQHPETAAAGLDAAIEAADLISMMSRPDEALQRIDSVLAALPLADGVPGTDTTRRAQALLVRCQALNGLGRPQEGPAAAEAALALPGVPQPLQARLLHSAVYGYFLDNRIALALAGAERSLLLWRSTGNRRSIARAHANIGLMNSLLGRLDVARREMGQSLALAREMRMPELVREQLLNLAYTDLQEGRPQAALDALDEAWNAAPTFTSNSSPVFIRGMQVHGHAHLGQLGVALEMAEDGHRRAVEIGGAHGITDNVSMVLDLATDIGDFVLAERWVGSLPARELMESLYRTKLVFNLVHLALARGDLARAEAELKTLGDVAALVQPFDRGYAALRHAELCLARADAEGALGWLDRGSPDAQHIEARALMLAARVRALRLFHGDAAPACAQARAEAQALLEAPGHVPALAALALCEACGFDRAERVQRLADSLDGRPAARQSFLARWTGADLQR